MVNDKNNEELNVGDKVYVACTIVSVDEAQECNLHLETDELTASGAAKVPPAGVQFCVNSKQVILGTKHDKTLGLPEGTDPKLPATHHTHKHETTLGVSPVADVQATDAVAKVAHMTSKDKLKDVIDHDPRVTVQKAAQARLDELNK